jgi:hypothetical protein
MSEETPVNRRSVLKTTAAGVLSLGSLSTPGAARAADGPPIVSTRGHFETGWNGAYRVDGIGPEEYETDGSVPGLDAGCAPDVTIVSGAFLTDVQDLVDRIDSFRAGLATGGYDGTFLGFAWDGDTHVWEWWSASDIATWNGPKLAAFTRDLKQACPEATIRYLTYSLGGQVVLSALETLADWSRDDDRVWGPDDRIDTVSLFGVAVPSDSVAADGRYGPAIESETGQVGNYWDTDDGTLNLLYYAADWENALGSNGVDGTAPEGYTDYRIDVANHFKLADPEEQYLDEVAQRW